MNASTLANAESWLSVIGWVKLAAAFLVAIGVALEFGGDWASRPYEKIVADAREQQLAGLRSETARLSSEAEAARRETAVANLRVAEANLATARALRSNAIASQQAAVTVEQHLLANGYIAPEMLSEGARPFQITPKISSFAGKRFDIVVTSSDIHLAVLLELLRQSLKSAGWIEVDRNDDATGGQQSLAGSDTGMIKVFARGDPELFPAAEALTTALNAVGIAATLYPDSETVDSNNIKGVIHVLVSPKPSHPMPPEQKP